MNDANREKVEKFLRSLMEALGPSRSQSEGIVEEVRADLEAHVERFQSEGLSEDEAVERGLGELGNPYELAHHMRREVPPFGGSILTIVRYLAATGLILWTLLLLWYFRAWTYGFEPAVIALSVFFHLPAILLLWPRIVWRKNWLFGLIPAGLGVVMALFVTLAGVKSSSEVIAIEIHNNAETPAAPVPTPAVADSRPSRPPLIFLASALGAVALVLLMAMQQRSQRRVALLAVLLAVGIIEAVFQLEERTFRQDRDRVGDYFASSFQENGVYPTGEAFDSEGPRMRAGGETVTLHADGEGFTMFWSRPLSSGFSIVYSSTDDRIWIQD